MRAFDEQVQAESVDVAQDVVIGATSRIYAKSVRLARGACIGENVEIACDHLDLGEGARIASDNRIVCPQIRWARGCGLGHGGRITLNRSFQLGARSHLGQRLQVRGQRFEAGSYLWLKDDVIVGGGGAFGPRSNLIVGDHVTIIDRTYINLAEQVTIGSDTALSYNVVLLTHGAWQPALMGFRTRSAAVSIGTRSVVYLNSTVLPGVTIGDYATIGAGSVVHRDVPSHCLAAGNPARLVKGPQGYPKPLGDEEKVALVRGILRDYVETLPDKGVAVVEDALSARGSFAVLHAGTRTEVAFLTEPGAGSARAQITISLGPVPEDARGTCHFELDGEQMIGPASPIAEDLRDYFRRRAIRIFTGESFRTLPPADVARLRQQLRPRP